MQSAKLWFFVDFLDYRFYLPRPQKSAVLCGITVITGKEDAKDTAQNMEEEIHLTPSVRRNHDDYYYDESSGPANEEN